MTRLVVRFTPFALLIVHVSASLAVAADEEAPSKPEQQPAAEVAAADETPPAKHELRYKLVRGDVLRFEVTHRASIRSTIDETTQAAQTRTDSVKVWKVTDVLPSGEIEFMNVVERVHMINQLPDRDPVTYDSERDKVPPPGFEDAARNVGVPLSVVRITPHGKIVRREMKVRGQNMDEDAPVAMRLPEEPVAVGETWDDPLDVQVTLSGGGTKMIQSRRHHKLTAVANGIATIQVTYQVLSPIDAHIECQLVQRLMEGEVRFDIETGRVAAQKMDIDKRILGFAGPTSSMQYIMRMEEQLLQDAPKVAVTPVHEPPSAAQSQGQTNRSARSIRSTNRPQQSGRNNRR